MVVSRFPYAIPTLPGGKKPPFVWEHAFDRSEWRCISWRRLMLRTGEVGEV
ncbi:hypothetical protein YC2023_049051 [Brassica napus]